MDLVDVFTAVSISKGIPGSAAAEAIAAAEAAAESAASVSPSTDDDIAYIIGGGV